MRQPSYRLQRDGDYFCHVDFNQLRHPRPLTKEAAQYASETALKCEISQRLLERVWLSLDREYRQLHMHSEAIAKAEEVIGERP